MQGHGKWLLMAAAGLWAVPGTAQITDVRGSTLGTLVISPGPGSGVFPDSPTTRIYRSSEKGYGAGFAANVDIGETSIYFDNGAMSAGAFNRSRAVTDVAIDIFNGGTEPTLSGIRSVLFESSFGFYISTFGQASGCAGATLPNCPRVTTGDSFGDFVVAAGGVGDALAGASFSFEVLYNDVSVRRIGGSITMLKGPDGVSFVEDFGSGENFLPDVLTDFALEPDAGDYARVWRWDTTPFFAAFDSLLPPGQSATVTYRITTESWSQAQGLFNTTEGRNMIVGFACVRDPVGRGGGGGEEAGSLRAAADSLLQVAAVIPLANTCLDDLPAFGGNVLGLPRIENGILVFEPPANGVIPEPATWAMMIAGFGAVGLALRRRRPVAEVARA